MPPRPPPPPAAPWWRGRAGASRARSSCVCPPRLQPRHAPLASAGSCQLAGGAERPFHLLLAAICCCRCYSRLAVAARPSCAAASRLLDWLALDAALAWPVSVLWIGIDSINSMSLINLHVHHKCMSHRRVGITPRNDVHPSHHHARRLLDRGASEWGKGPTHSTPQTVHPGRIDR